MPVENTPALQALQQQVVPPPPPAKRERSPRTDDNAAFRAELAASGGNVTSFVQSPAMKAAVDAVKADSYAGYGSQSKLINAAVLRLLGTPEPAGARLGDLAKAALAKIRIEWQIDSNEEAIGLALRGFVHLCERHRVVSLDFGDGE